MRIAVSSLAWDSLDEDVVFPHLKFYGIDGVEVVFTKIKPWAELTKHDLYVYKNKLESNGLIATSAQSLFFGINTYTATSILEHFKRLIEYSNIMGIQTLVFGSPSMRKGDPTPMCGVFENVDRLLDNTNICVVIEPNARIYGGEYWNTVPEIVRCINSLKNVKTMIDTHNIVLENRSVAEEYLSNIQHIRHVHFSEKNLALLENLDVYRSYIDLLKSNEYDGIVTYEVLKAKNISDSIRKFANLFH